MAELIDYSLSKEDCWALSNEAFGKGEKVKSISYLKKALEMDEKYLDASLALSLVYSNIGAMDFANAVLFKALLKCSDDEKNTIFSHLAINFLELNDERAAQYYLENIDSEYEIPQELFDQVGDNGGSGFELVSKDKEQRNSEIIDKAFSLIRNGKLDEAMLLVDKVPADSQHKETADYIAVISRMAKEDFQGVIDNAELIISQGRETLALLVSEATAYLMLDKKDKAYEILDRILEKDYTSMTEMVNLLPLLVNMDMHVDVVKYCKRILRRNPYQINVMMWLAQALYNIGQVKESIKLFKKIQLIYGEHTCPGYYLSEIATKPETLPYCISVPTPEKLIRFTKFQDLLKVPKEVMQENLKNEDVRGLIDWVYQEGGREYEKAASLLLKSLKGTDKEDIIQQQLIDIDMSYDKLIGLIIAMLEEGKLEYKFSVVVQNKYKYIDFKIPKALFIMPSKLRDAIEYAICEIIYSDDEPNNALGDLTDSLNHSFMNLNGEFAPVYCTPLQVKMLRSVETMIGTLLVRTYEISTDKVLEDLIDDHGIKRNTFKKYYKMFFGEDYLGVEDLDEN